MELTGTILKAIFDSSDDVWFFVARDYSILFFNKKAYDNGKILHAKELRAGDSILDFARDTKNRIDENFVNCFSRAVAGEIVKQEEHIEYNATSIWLKSKYIPVYDKSKLIGISITVEDISAQKTLELDRLKAQEEIVLLSNKREEFVNIASHELKTPLTSLKASLQILSQKVSKKGGLGELDIFLSKCLVSVHKLQTLIRDLLDSNKILRGVLELNQSSFKLEEIIDQCCDHIRLMGKIRLSITGDVQTEVYADKQKIEQVLSNFLDNVLKYAPDTEEIIVGAENLGNKIKVFVEDFGPGIPEDKTSLIFQRYYQGESRERISAGMGLGLYISEGIVRQHEGEIGVHSVPAKGTTFWFTLPL